MYRIFNSLSIEMYTIITILAICLNIFGVMDLKKKKPGHPFKYVLYCLFPTVISLLINKYAYEYDVSSLWLIITDVVSIVFIFIFFVTFAFSTYLTYKKGYMSEERKRLLLSTVIPCIIVFVLCVVGIILIKCF